MEINGKFPCVGKQLLDRKDGSGQFWVVNIMIPVSSHDLPDDFKPGLKLLMDEKDEKASAFSPGSEVELSLAVDVGTEPGNNGQGRFPRVHWTVLKASPTRSKAAV